MSAQVIDLFTPAGPTPRQGAINAFLGMADRLPPAAFVALREASYELLLRIEPDESAQRALAWLFDEISEALDRTESNETNRPGTRVTP